MSTHGGADFYAWRTSDEVEYVMGMGSKRVGYAPRKVRVPSRLEMLLDYRRAMDRRAKWGEVDPDRVREVVEREIEDEMNRMGAPKQKVFVPTNGHGVEVGQRQYAQPVGQARREIRRDESGDDE